MRVGVGAETLLAVSHEMKILNVTNGDSTTDLLRLADLGETVLEIVMIDDHPAVERFLGLGQLSPEQLRHLFSERQPMTLEQRGGRIAHGLRSMTLSKAADDG